MTDDDMPNCVVCGEPVEWEDQGRADCRNCWIEYGFDGRRLVDVGDVDPKRCPVSFEEVEERLEERKEGQEEAPKPDAYAVDVDEVTTFVSVWHPSEHDYVNEDACDVEPLFREKPLRRHEREQVVDEVIGLLEQIEETRKEEIGGNDAMPNGRKVVRIRELESDLQQVRDRLSELREDSKEEGGTDS